MNLDKCAVFLGHLPTGCYADVQPLVIPGHTIYYQGAQKFLRVNPRKGLHVPVYNLVVVMLKKEKILVEVHSPGEH